MTSLQRLGALGAMGVVVGVGVSAQAAYIPPTGTIKYKLLDATNVYRQLDVDPELDAVERGNLVNMAGIPQAGDQSFTAFRITTYTLNAGPDSNDFGGFKLVGVVTFTQVQSVEGPLDFMGATLVNANLVDSSRPHEAGPPGTVGRFFLFATDDANAGAFDFAGASTVSEVDFSTGPSDNLVTDSDGDTYTIDHLDGFTRGAGDYELVLTGGLVPDDDSDVDDFLTTSGTDGHPEQAFAGTIAAHDIALDGGLWFNLGLIDGNASFQINQVVFSDLSAGHTHDRGDPTVYAGGWQISSEDPIQINVVPEPASAVALGVGAGLMMVRRRRLMHG